jgi:hypothetical protein
MAKAGALASIRLGSGGASALGGRQDVGAGGGVAVTEITIHVAVRHLRLWPLPVWLMWLRVGNGPRSFFWVTPKWLERHSRGGYVPRPAKRAASGEGAA